jgi:voltage-gated potassium channel Kch
MTVDESDSSVLYFSYVTLTTLGYGDISPVKDPARTLAFLEAVTGQLYLVVLVARLVGLHIAHKTVQRMDGEKNSGVSQ